MELQDDVVDIWRADMNVDPIFLETCYGMLSSDELIRADKYTFERDRNYFIARRGILRTLIGQYLNCESHAIVFNYGPYGKPYLSKYPNFQFNISHSQDRFSWPSLRIHHWVSIWN